MESNLIPLCASIVNCVGQLKFWCLISGILTSMMQAYRIPGMPYMWNGKDHKVNFFMYEVVASLLERKSEQRTSAVDAHQWGHFIWSCCILLNMEVGWCIKEQPMPILLQGFDIKLNESCSLSCWDWSITCSPKCRNYVLRHGGIPIISSMDVMLSFSRS